jgi:hypothetical protein
MPAPHAADYYLAPADAPLPAPVPGTLPPVLRGLVWLLIAAGAVMAWAALAVWLLTPDGT